jgi:hypothetical protein
MSTKLGYEIYNTLREANICLDDHKILCLLRNLKHYYQVHTNQPFDSNFNQENLIQKYIIF